MILVEAGIHQHGRPLRASFHKGRSHTGPSSLPRKIRWSSVLSEPGHGYVPWASPRGFTMLLRLLRSWTRRGCSWRLSRWYRQTILVLWFTSNRKYEGRLCLVHCARYTPIPDSNNAEDDSWKCKGFPWCGRKWSIKGGFSIVTRNLAGKAEITKPDNKEIKSFLNKQMWNGGRMHADYRQYLRDFMTRWEAGGRHVENISLVHHPNPKAPRRRDWSPVLAGSLVLPKRSYQWASSVPLWASAHWWILFGLTG